jgi:hypothetical protein
MSERTVVTRLVGRDQMSDASNSAARSSSKLGAALGKVGGVMKAGLAGGAALAAGGVALLGKWVVDGVKGAISYQTVLAKTAQVIKTTGGEARVSVNGVKDLAAQLETLSGVDEELIINSQNVLLTFTNIKNVGKDRIFDMATKSALDMSVALGSDLQGASIQVGKALNDPIKGVSALSKVGVSFTEKQKDVIKSLVKTGDTAAAQKIILAELNKEFGGQAAAAGKGFEGTMARLQDVIADTGREVGQALLPKLTEAAQWLGDKIPLAVDDFKAGWSGAGKGASTEIGALADSLHRLSDQMSAIGSQAGDVKGNGFVKFAHSAIGALTTVSEGFELLGVNWRSVTLTISKWNDTVAINFDKMINNIQAAGAKLPGPLGDDFRKMRDEGKARINELQAQLNKTNTKIAQNRIQSLEIQLRHLGRQKPTPKVNANIAQARAEIAKITARLRGIKDEYVNVFVQEIRRDEVRAGLGTGRALGGPVMPGRPYVVGDGPMNRPELFVPRQSGKIVSKVGTGGGGDTYNIYASGLDAASVGDAVVQALKSRPAGSAKIPASAVAGR